MKKFTYILMTLLITSTGLWAQGQVDALRFSREDMFGTARAMSMGGAFGALGGDQTGVSINPAGIAVYRSSEIVGTFGLMGERATVGNERDGRTTFNMPSMGFVVYVPLRNDAMPFINFGFTSNQSQSFNRRIHAIGSPNSTMLDFIADRSFGLNSDNLWISSDPRDPDPFRSQPWLSVFGYNSFLIDPPTDGSGHWTPVNTSGYPAVNEIRMTERGYINNFGFTMGTTINNVLSLGAALSVSEIWYRLDSEYHEDFMRGNYSMGGYTLENFLSVDGAGVGGKFGLIFRPIHELRIGVSYHTPTWFSLTERYSATVIDDMAHFVTEAGYQPGETYSAIFPNEYRLRTPGKWTLSLATVGRNFLISVDYELVDFRNMQLALPPGVRGIGFDDDNYFISMDYRLASTLRLGVEYWFTPQFSGRLGYAWMQNPNSATFRHDANPAVAGSNTIFRMEGDANFFTAGFGYRFNRNFFLDFAMVYKTQNDQLFPFPNLWSESGELVIDATPFDLRNRSLRGMLTLGYRF